VLAKSEKRSKFGPKVGREFADKFAVPDAKGGYNNFRSQEKSNSRFAFGRGTNITAIAQVQKKG
jgi:hypothetical protein